jgi:hypothetical protein
MQSFKEHLLNELLNVKPVENEAMLTLRKIIDMVDDGHVDYSPEKIKINVGKLIKNKKYSNLDIYILKGSKSARIGRHSDTETHAIFLYAPKLPARENIDDFLADQGHTASFKNLFKKFFNDAVFDGTEDAEGSSYEKGSELNTRSAFEKSYIELVDKMNGETDKYTSAKGDIDSRIEKSNDELGHKEILGLSLDKMKKDMLGNTAEEFKSKAIQLYGKENYKLLDKEFKTKLDARLSDYYEQRVR